MGALRSGVVHRRKDGFVKPRYSTPAVVRRWPFKEAVKRIRDRLLSDELTWKDAEILAVGLLYSSFEDPAWERKYLRNHRLLRTVTNGCYVMTGFVIGFFIAALLAHFGK